MTSRDFGFLTLRNVIAYQQNGTPVPPNSVLITSSNGAGVFSDTVTISSINPSSVNAHNISVTSAITTQMIYANIISSVLNITSTINTSRIIVSKIDASEIVTSTMSASTITAPQINASANLLASSITVAPSSSSQFPITISNGNISVPAGYYTGINVPWFEGIESIPYPLITSSRPGGLYVRRGYENNEQVDTLLTTSEDINGVASSVTRLYIAAQTGNIGIGTSTPQVKLDVIGDIRANNISSLGGHIILIDASGTPLVIDSLGSTLYVDGHPILTEATISTVSTVFWDEIGGGTIYNKNIGISPYYYQVGVGTRFNTLNATLDVSYSGTSSSIGYVFNTSSFNNRFSIETFSSSLSAELVNNQKDFGGCSLRFKKSNNFTSTIVSTSLGTIDFYGVNQNNSSVRGAYILAQQTGNASTFTESALHFLTCTSSSQNTNMIITAKGNVGIGTISPNYTLDINGNACISSTIITNYLTVASSINANNITGASSVQTNYLTVASSINTITLDAVSSIQTNYIKVSPSPNDQFPVTIDNQNITIPHGHIIGYNVPEFWTISTILIPLITASTPGGLYIRRYGNNNQVSTELTTSEDIGNIASSVTRLYLQAQTGYVGIGTIQPEANLHVIGNTLISSGNVTINNSLNSAININSNNGSISSFCEISVKNGGANDRSLQFYNMSNIGTTNPAFRFIGGDGNTNPIFEMYGDKTSKFYSSLTVNGSLYASSVFSPTFISSAQVSTTQISGVSTINGIKFPFEDDALWSLNGTNIYNDNTGNVGIGTSTPTAKLHVIGNIYQSTYTTVGTSYIQIPSNVATLYFELIGGGGTGGTGGNGGYIKGQIDVSDFVEQTIHIVVGDTNGASYITIPNTGPLFVIAGGGGDGTSAGAPQYGGWGGGGTFIQSSITNFIAIGGDGETVDPYNNGSHGGQGGQITTGGSGGSCNFDLLGTSGSGPSAQFISASGGSGGQLSGVKGGDGFTGGGQGCASGGGSSYYNSNYTTVSLSYAGNTVPSNILTGYGRTDQTGYVSISFSPPSIIADSNVGINTDNPQYSLDVNGTIRVNHLQGLSTSIIPYPGNQSGSTIVVNNGINMNGTVLNNTGAIIQGSPGFQNGNNILANTIFGTGNTIMRLTQSEGYWTYLQANTIAFTPPFTAYDYNYIYMNTAERSIIGLSTINNNTSVATKGYVDDVVGSQSYYIDANYGDKNIDLLVTSKQSVTILVRSTNSPFTLAFTNAFDAAVIGKRLTICLSYDSSAPVTVNAPTYNGGMRQYIMAPSQFGNVLEFVCCFDMLSPSPYVYWRCVNYSSII